MEKTELDSNSQRGVNSLWIFGYGSLVWKPDFKYKKKRNGYIKGFVRRFWQGNTTHRGTPEKPGRVATLVEDNEGMVWGVAYQVTGPQEIQEVMKYLNNREIDLGGYKTIETKFYLQKNSRSNIKVLAYTATPLNPDYLGAADTNRIAEEIVQTSGHAGTNTEYVTNLADYLKIHIPEDTDHHLFELDSTIRMLENSKNIGVRDAVLQDKAFTVDGYNKDNLIYNKKRLANFAMQVLHIFSWHIGKDTLIY